MESLLGPYSDASPSLLSRVVPSSTILLRRTCCLVKVENKISNEHMRSPGSRNMHNSYVQDLSSVPILWLRCFDDWFDFYWHFFTKKYRRCSSEGQIQDGHRCHLEKWTFEPEHLKLCLKTLFWVCRPRGIRYWHQYDVIISFGPRNPR